MLGVPIIIAPFKIQGHSILRPEFPINNMRGELFQTGRRIHADSEKRLQQPGPGKFRPAGILRGRGHIAQGEAEPVRHAPHK